ncbi:MAG TPA: trypsin-like serine protease [Candidatus Limnocylindria bacterium]|nr:trypsin-like serine protease [Candidatus Limnocylindria bacterium]
MKKLLAIAAIVASLLLTSGSAALAQTGDAQPDNGLHPNVGAFLLPRVLDGSLRIICSGTLVSPTVFMTASHCTAFALSLGHSDAYITFDPNFGTDPGHNIFSTPYHGTIHHNPAYKPPYHADVSVIVLDAAVTGITPAKIAPLGFLDGLRNAGTIKTTEYLNVGYGSAEQRIVPTVGPTFPFDGIRKWTISGFYALDPQYVHLNQNLHQAFSGTGYGDSGGPTFVQTTNGPVIVSVVSTGDVPCWATSVNQRVDTKASQDFLAQFLSLN